jgi:putative transposase
VADRLLRELALAALCKALTMPSPDAGLIHHAYRDSQYCSADYQAELREHGILISMSGKGAGAAVGDEGSLPPLRHRL